MANAIRAELDSTELCFDDFVKKHGFSPEHATKNLLTALNSYDNSVTKPKHHFGSPHNAIAN